MTNSKIVDTLEEVEAVAGSIAARIVEVYAGYGNVMELPDTELMEAATMLRRLHQRAVDAERERDEARANTDLAWRSARFQRESRNASRASLATARADALREAADVVNAEERRFPDFSMQHAGEIMTARRIAAAFLALIEQPTTTGET